MNKAYPVVSQEMGVDKWVLADKNDFSE